MIETVSHSIIIASYENPTDVDTLVESVHGQLSAADEIIIIDDGSSRETREALKPLEREKVTLVFERHGGVSHVRNRGVQEANGTDVVFVDQDAVAAPTWLGELKKSGQEAPAVQGNFWDQTGSSRVDEEHALWRRVVSSAKEKTTAAGVNTRNFAIDRGTLLEVCGEEPFDVNPNAHGGEDVLLGIQLREAAVPIVENPDAVVTHTGDPSTLRKLVRQKYGHARSDALRGVLPDDTFTRANYRRAVSEPAAHGVRHRVALALWGGYVAGAAVGRRQERRNG